MRFFLSIFLLFPLIITAQIVGRAVGITDGDTFTLLKKDSISIKVRLYGIDCPEKGQPFSNICKKYLSDLIFNKAVRLEEKGKDRYGRTIAIVFLGTININESLLADGIAWHYKYFDKNPRWAALEKSAKDNKKGLWKDDNAIPPWEWRKTN